MSSRKCDLCYSSTSHTIFITLWAHLYLASFLWLCYPVCQPCLFPLLVYTQVCFTCIQVAFAFHFLTFVFLFLSYRIISKIYRTLLPENVKIAFCISIARAVSVLFPQNSALNRCSFCQHACNILSILSFSSTEIFFSN